MTRLSLWILIGSFALRLCAQTPDTEFLGIYTLIQEGEAFEKSGQSGSAMDRFQQARRDLERFAKSNPSWNQKIVKFRLEYLAGKVDSLKDKLPAVPAKAETPPQPAALPLATKPGELPINDRDVKAEALSLELASVRTRAEDAERRAQATQRALGDAETRASTAEDRTARIALELRSARDRLDVLEAAQSSLEKTRERLEGDRTTLEARLREALAPKPAAVDPAELARAQERNLLLMKENEILKAGLDHQMAENKRILQTAGKAVELEKQLSVARNESNARKRQNDDLKAEREKLQAHLDSVTRKADEHAGTLRVEIDQLRRELASVRSSGSRASPSDPTRELSTLRRELDDQRATAEELRRDNDKLVREIGQLTAVRVTPASLKVPEVAPPEAAADAARLRRLERERDELRAELEETRTELQRRDPAPAERRARELAGEVDRLSARVASLEATPDPYSPVELALFQAPAGRPAPQPLELAQAPLAPPTTPTAPGSPSNSSPAAASAAAPATGSAAAPAPAAAQSPASPAATLAPEPTQPTASPTPPPAAAPTSPQGPAPAATPTTNTTPAGASAPSVPGSSGPPGSVRRRTARDLPPGAGALVAQAQRAFARKQFDEAEKAYRDILQMDQKNVFTLGNLAAILLERGRLDDCEALLKQALELDPQDPFSLSLQGIVRFRQQRYDEAFDALSRSAQLDPENADTQNYLGITLSQRGQRKAAESALRKALRIDPGSPAAHYNLAVVYATQKPPFLALARYHYDKSRRSGQPANPSFERVLSGESAPTP